MDWNGSVIAEAYKKDDVMGCRLLVNGEEVGKYEVPLAEFVANPIVRLPVGGSASIVLAALDLTGDAA